MNERGFLYAVKQSTNFEATCMFAQQVDSIELLRERFEEEGIRNLNNNDKHALTQLYIKAAFALANSDKETLSKIGVENITIYKKFTNIEKSKVSNVDVCVITGNSKIAIVYGSYAGQTSKSIGVRDLVTLWYKDHEDWQLLSYSSDSVSIELTITKLITLFSSNLVVNPTVSSAPPPSLDIKFEEKKQGERFGFYVWNSNCKLPYFEIAEFELNGLTRWFLVHKDSEKKKLMQED